jgi:hypothetical protein
MTDMLKPAFKQKVNVLNDPFVADDGTLMDDTVAIMDDTLALMGHPTTLSEEIKMGIKSIKPSIR